MKLSKHRSSTDTRHVIPIRASLPITIADLLEAEIQKRKLESQLDSYKLSGHKPNLRESELSYWLANTKSGLEASFEVKQLILKSSVKEAKQWLWARFYAENPEKKPKMGRPSGFSPTKERKDLTNSILTEALELYFKKINRKERAHVSR